MTTVQELILRAHERFAPLPAVADDAGGLTFGQLADLVARVRTFLTAAVDEVPRRVGIVAANSVDFAIVDQACFTSGVVRVGINRRSTVAEVKELAETAGIGLLFADSEWAQHLVSSDVEIPVVPLDADADGRRFRDRLVDWEPSPASELDASAPAALIFTSGTTGRPKAITVTQANLAGTVRNVLIAVPASVGTSVLHPIPLTHAAMQLSLAFGSIGLSQRFMAQGDPHAILDEVERAGHGILSSVPTVVGMLAREQRDRPRDLGSLRAVVYGGSSISPDDLRSAVAAFGPTLYQMYAQSESSLPITCLDPADHLRAVEGDATRMASAGRPGPFTELAVIDDSGARVERGERGEILVRGDTVTPGYLDDPATTDSAFLKDWLRTGDVGFLTDDGYLVIVDRLKDVIISGGFNVFPSEVERALEGVGGVREIAVYGAPDPKWGEVVCVAVVADGAVELESVQEVARRTLSAYKIPRQLRRYDVLPVNATGKVLRRVLREWHDA